MQASHTYDLVIARLPPKVAKAHIFPFMKHKALLLLGQYCDNWYEVHLTSETLYITHMIDASLSLQGYRDKSTGMWTIDILDEPNRTDSRVQTTRIQANNVYEYKKKQDIVTYLYKAMLSPVKSTWIKAINAGVLNTWPGFTSDLVEKHLKKSNATVKGHLRQTRQNLRSKTKKTSLHQIHQLYHHHVSWRGPLSMRVSE